MEKKRKLDEIGDEDSLVPNPTNESLSLMVDSEPLEDPAECSVIKEDDRKKHAASLLSSEGLAEQSQLIIDEMEIKRKNDENLIAEFRKTLEIQTDNWCDMIERTLAKGYEKNNDACQEKLQQLYTILGRINRLEQELMAFKESLKMLYTDVEES